MKFYRLKSTVYLLPTVDISFDRFYEGGLIYLDINFSWMIWGFSINIINNTGK